VFGHGRPASRSQRLAEFVELLVALLTCDGVTWQGDYYTAVNARNVPGCTQRPRAPFVIAANGDALFAILSGDVFLLLTEARGWSVSAYRSWVARTVRMVLNLKGDNDES
jgi:alkanesulfonate monooxygenase SsuD/methylene tetrahydromethanopterin reductase-like flavin-dependent oxidoreductase (luciferase family)